MIVGEHSTKYTPPILGVVLIDCCDVNNQSVPTKQQINYFYQNILTTVNDLDIKCVVNAMTRADTQTLEPTLCLIAPTHLTESLSEFIDLANSKQITHWYVVGQSWQMCVHENNIGLNNLAKLLDLNFYSNLTSFLKINGSTVEHEDFINDKLSWKFVPRFGYQLTQGVL